MRVLKRLGALVVAPLFVVMIVALVVIVAGCASATTADGPSQANFITLKNTSPGQLDVRVMVRVGGYDTTTRDTTALDVRFVVGERVVKMVGDESVVCNATTLQRYAGSFELQATTTSLAGKTMTCMYTSGSSSATIVFTIPAAPVILSPQDGRSVTRSASTMVSYRVAAGVLPSVVATGQKDKAIASPGATSVSQAALDTTSFTVGPGQIALTQELTTLDGQNNGFKSLVVQISAMTMVAVTWA